MALKANGRSRSRPESPPRSEAAAASGLDRVLPHSLDAERAALGSMLLDEAAIGETISVLADAGPDCFFLPKNQELYKHIVELYDERKPLDGVVIKDELQRRGVFESLGGFEYLSNLIGAVPSALRVRHYAQIVRSKYLLRQLIQATHETMQLAYDDQFPTDQVMDQAEQRIFAVTEQRVTGVAQTLPDLIHELFKRIETREPQAGEPTGYLELDELTSGFMPAELIIIAGRPSMGKTALGLNVAENMAIGEGRPVLFFSLEMSRQQVAQRVLCSRARVDAHRLRRGRIADDEMHRLQAVAGDIGRAPLYVDDSSNLSILELRARARMAFRRHGVRAIFVDYLQLMHAPGADSRQQEVAEISRGLKALAKELNVPVVAMAQLNRNPEDRTGNRPRMSDLRESGAIEQDADVIALLHREAYYKDGADAAEDSTAELIIAKQRNGPVGTVQLHFNRQWTRFDNHAGPAAGAGYADTSPGGADIEFP